MHDGNYNLLSYLIFAVPDKILITRCNKLTAANSVRCAFSRQVSTWAPDIYSFRAVPPAVPLTHLQHAACSMQGNANKYPIGQWVCRPQRQCRFHPQQPEFQGMDERGGQLIPDRPLPHNHLLEYSLLEPCLHTRSLPLTDHTLLRRQDQRNNA